MALREGSLWDTEFGVTDIDALSAAFNERAIWQSTLAAADSFWVASQSARSPLDGEVLWAWHLLALSVGNFKRQAPISLPVLGNPLVAPPTPRPNEVEIPVSERLAITLKVDDPDSWRLFCKTVDGIGVATASTLLSALWPGKHIVIDRWDIDAARGLDYRDAVANKLVEGGGLKDHAVSWTAYEWLLKRVLAKAEATRRPPVEVERALFILAPRAQAAQIAAYMERKNVRRKRDVPKKALVWDGPHGYESFLLSELVAARQKYQAGWSPPASFSAN
jgi:hypothetical protein